MFKIFVFQIILKKLAILIFEQNLIIDFVFQLIIVFNFFAFNFFKIRFKFLFTIFWLIKLKLHRIMRCKLNKTIVKNLSRKLNDVICLIRIVRIIVFIILIISLINKLFLLFCLSVLMYLKSNFLKNTLMQKYFFFRRFLNFDESGFEFDRNDSNLMIFNKNVIALKKISSDVFVTNYLHA